MILSRIILNNTVRWAEIRSGEFRLLSKPPYEGVTYSGETADFDESRLLAPCSPGKIVCVGKNYKDHALELGGSVPENPILFIKPTTALNCHNGDIIYPGISKRVDYEGELAVVIGKRARHVRPDEAFDYIQGYTCFNDVTARDIQETDGQWTRAKSFDTFAPAGPYLITDVDVKSLSLTTRLNGKIMQSANTSMFIWGIPYIISFITECMTLLPGDVIATGTPAGIGPMNIGDEVEVEIESIGILKNKVIGE